MGFEKSEWMSIENGRFYYSAIASAIFVVSMLFRSLPEDLICTRHCPFWMSIGTLLSQRLIVCMWREDMVSQHECEPRHTGALVQTARSDLQVAGCQRQ